MMERITSDNRSHTKLTILLIEDDPTILSVHKVFLEKIGFVVDTAITGEEAFNKFQNYHYPLIILDGGLPDTDGKALGMRMREYEKKMSRLRTPLILLSGYTAELVKDWCQQADIDDYAIKPVHPHNLKELVLRYITP